MSRTQYDPEERSAMALEAIADTLDDLLSLAAATVAVVESTVRQDPDISGLEPLDEVLAGIALRRASRADL